MTAPQPYVTFPGNAREALTFYASVFGGRAEMYTLAEFNRTDGPPEAIAHGEVDGPVRIGGSDAAPGQPGVSMHGLMLALLGTAEPEVLHRWFDALADGGTVVDPLGPKPWGDSDGQVIDRFGLHWLIGYEGQQ